MPVFSLSFSDSVELSPTVAILWEMAFSTAKRCRLIGASTGQPVTAEEQDAPAMDESWGLYELGERFVTPESPKSTRTWVCPICSL